MANQEGIDRIKARLDNIRSVEPILGAMRTISLGSWQAALKRKKLILAYTERLLALLPALVPLLHAQRPFWPWKRATRTTAPVAVIVVGSERGLCGAFNSTLVRHVESELERFQGLGVEVELHALGSRAIRALERLDITIAWSQTLPVTALPASDLASELTRTWLERYEARELDAVHVIYNAYRHSALYESLSVRLIPPPLPSSREGDSQSPVPYIDTDPDTLYTRLIVMWATTEVYRILLDSAAAEHSARYQLMEGAAQNSNRLIDELTLSLHSARQQAITAEMQELAAGAGLVGN